LPTPGGSDEEHVRGLLQVAAGGELVDQGGVDAGGGVVVEVGQGGRGRQGGEPDPSGESTGFGGVDLDREEAFQGRGQGQPLGVGSVQDGGQVLGGVVQLQGGEVAAELLVQRGMPGTDRCGQGRGFGCGHGVFVSFMGLSVSGCGGGVRVLSPAAAAAYTLRSTTPASPRSAWLAGAWPSCRVRRAAACAAAPALGGSRSLLRCGRAVVDAARAACSKAVTWASVRMVAPAPGGARVCLAITVGRGEARPGAGVVAMSRVPRSGGGRASCRGLAGRSG